MPLPDAVALPAALAGRAVATPEEPWLFDRGAHDWGWRSWAQVADQVARGAAILRRARELAGERLGDAARVAFADRLHPDAVAVALAVQAAGGVAVPVAEREEARVDAWAQVGEVASAVPAVALPAVRSRLARWTPELDALRPGDPDAGAFGRRLPGGRRDDRTRSHRELCDAARAWSARLPPPRGRPIVLASPEIGRRHRQVLLAWTLTAGAAWVLEDEPALLLPSALRNRPTLVLAPGADLALLATALRERRHRRWHRLEAVGVTDDAPAEVYLGEEWEGLDVPVVRLGECPRGWQ